MNGWEQAREWLAVNGSGWEIRNAETTLAPGLTIGSPTRLYVSVKLRRGNEYDEWLIGNGASMLEAVRNAVGEVKEEQG